MPDKSNSSSEHVTGILAVLFGGDPTERARLQARKHQAVRHIAKCLHCQGALLTHLEDSSFDKNLTEEQRIAFRKLYDRLDHAMYADPEPASQPLDTQVQPAADSDQPATDAPIEPTEPTE